MNEKRIVTANKLERRQLGQSPAKGPTHTRETQPTDSLLKLIASFSKYLDLVRGYGFGKLLFGFYALVYLFDLSARSSNSLHPFSLSAIIRQIRNNVH